MIVAVVVLAVGTVVERLYGSDVAATLVYGTWWFVGLWALMAVITLLIYAAPLHGSIWKSFQKPVFSQIYIIFAFLSVVITYFGVNLFLGGVHAYN